MNKPRQLTSPLPLSSKVVPLRRPGAPRPRLRAAGAVPQRLTFDLPPRPLRNRNLIYALIASLLLHAVLLSIHFKLPERLNKAWETQLEVVLVNSKSASKPVAPQALAQVNLDGGGNTEQDRRAKSPLPPNRTQVEGTELIEAQRRVQQLETQQKRLMTQMQSMAAVRADPQPKAEEPEPPEEVSGADMAQNALAMARMEAQIARQVEEYNKRPRRKQITARTRGVSYAMYYSQWREKVERIGNLNYPESARGKTLTLQMVVSVKEDGGIEYIEIARSSGNSDVDRQAIRIAEMAAPYGKFSPEMRQEYQIFEIVSTWTFSQRDGFETEATR